MGIVDWHTVSISLGMTVYPHGGSDFESLLRSADRPLYQAKTSGRNRVAEVITEQLSDDNVTQS
jgi:diguanylate cyclase (GGDEF)-like protein